MGCKKCRHQRGTVEGGNRIQNVYPILQESHLLATFFGEGFKKVLTGCGIIRIDNSAHAPKYKIAKLSRFEEFMTLRRRLSSENRPIHSLFREICIQENETES